MTWAIVVTAPQCEKAVRDAMADAGFVARLPLCTTWRGRFTRTEVRRPVIANYVFTDLNPECEDYRVFASQGAVHVTRPHPAYQAKITEFIDRLEAWANAGVFDQVLPVPAKPKPAPKRRNRKARRIAGEAKRQAMELKEGLQVLLDEMTATPRVAA